MKKIGVYICHCGSNISDVVDVDKVEAAIAGTEGVHILKTTMFACADSAQKEMVDDIVDNKLEGLVVASCSTKLHVPTFRNVAKRAGLNPYQYVQVNIREQSSWAHSDHPAEATEKAIQLVRAGITRVQFARALDPIWIDAANSVAVIGAGVTGMNVALGLAGLGTKVYLVERNSHLGGRTLQWGKLTGSEKTGSELINKLSDELKQNEDIELFTNTEIESVSGSVGDYTLTWKGPAKDSKEHKVKVGAVIVATGFDPYTPEEGEFGYGKHPAVITLPELKEALNDGKSIESWTGKKVKQVAFIYCVGSCQVEGENKYCSRICCTTAIDTAIQIKKSNPGIDFIHMYRQIRTYGKQELFYEEASRNGDLFLKFEDDDPPEVDVENGQIRVKVNDLLTMGEELEMTPDLLVLITGMVPSSGYEKTAELFKAPIGRDKFFNEVHPKLRPVETVMDGIFIAGACQGPKSIPESVKSGFSAVAKAHALLHDEKIELEPTIARVDPEACEWCGLCEAVCPFDAIKQDEHKGKKVAAVIASSCKGCGMCNPVCPTDAIDLIGYTNDEMEGMIESLATIL